MITFYKGKLKKSDIEFIRDILYVGLLNIDEDEYEWHYDNNTQGFKDIMRLYSYLDKEYKELNKD